MMVGIFCAFHDQIERIVFPTRCRSPASRVDTEGFAERWGLFHGEGATRPHGQAPRRLPSDFPTNLGELMSSYRIVTSEIDMQTGFVADRLTTEAEIARQGSAFLAAMKERTC
jgi:hypothetical protein